VGQRQQQSQQQNTAPYFWESLRSLHTNIRFLSFDAPVRSLAVISASSEDGRSTIAMHLAQTAAVMGQRVLLVDADLRNPKIHKILDLPNIKGLSNVIAAEVDYQEAIHQVNCLSMKAEDEASIEASMSVESAWEGGFFVLSAGQIPPNPTNLLSSQKMQNLARQFEAAFDLVIYDTSPLLGLADSSLVATNTDASILVVGLGKTHRSAVEKALEQLKISQTPVLGVVANGVTSSTSA
jgi:Mrp family chromosome partitioning ATPase